MLLSGGEGAQFERCPRDGDALRDEVLEHLMRLAGAVDGVEVIEAAGEHLPDGADGGDA